MAREDPFAGLRLSEQAGTKLDQRLFTAEPKPVPSTRPPAAQPTPGPKSALVTSPPVSRREEVVAFPIPQFDLKDLPVYKASFLFTDEELETLEDLKLELRREYNTKVTKNDLMRCALHMLAEDHNVKKDQSYASRKMQQRRTSTVGESRRRRSRE